MRGLKWARVMGFGGWLLSACRPDNGQETGGETGTASGTGSSGEMETGGTAVTTGGSSGESGTNATTGGSSDTGLETDVGTSGVPGTGGDVTTSSGGTTLVDETTGGSTSGSTGDDTTTGGVMLIECNGCTCDPAVSYCQVAWSPTLDPPPEHPSGACPFIEAGSYDYGCVAYAQPCGDDPGCECVPETDPVCGCMDAGPFLFVNCDYP